MGDPPARFTLSFNSQIPAGSDEHSVCHAASKLYKGKNKRRLRFGLGSGNDRLSGCRQLSWHVETLTLSVTDEVSAESFCHRIAPSQNGTELASTITLLRAR